MVESFQQHNRFKIRILRTCSAIDVFLDKLLPYGTDEPLRKVSLPVSTIITLSMLNYLHLLYLNICNIDSFSLSQQSVRAPFNKTTMDLSSWKLSRDTINVGKIPEELTALATKITTNQPLPRFANPLPITSSIDLLAFASAPKLAENCHELKGNLAGITLKASSDLIKRDYEVRKDLLSILKTYLGLSTSAILLSSINQISEVKKHPPSSNILSEVANIKGFIENGITAAFLSTVSCTLKRAADARKKLREYTVQGLEPIQVRLALLEGPVFQEDLFDKESLTNASALAHPVTSGPLKRARIVQRPRFHQPPFRNFPTRGNQHWKKKYPSQSFHKSEPRKSDFRSNQQHHQNKGPNQPRGSKWPKDQQNRNARTNKDTHHKPRPT